MPLTLYYHPLSSFCQKVLAVLYENNTDFAPRIINLGDAGERAELLAVSPLGKFPAIHDSARKRSVFETTIIIEYLEHFFPGTRPLIPVDWEGALEVRLWDRLFDSYLQLPMQQIVSDRMRGAKGDLTKERATLQAMYALFDKELAGRVWAAGAAFSMADCAAAPALFYAGSVQAFPENLHHLKDYFDRLMDRPSTKRVMTEAKPYFQYFPFAESIPKRFL